MDCGIVMGVTGGTCGGEIRTDGEKRPTMDLALFLIIFIQGLAIDL